MSNNRANTASEFRTILTRIVEIKKALQESNHGEIAKQLGEFNDSLRIIEGNQAEFSDAVFKAIEKIQETMENGFKAIEARIVALEAKVDQDVATQANSVGSCTPSPNSSGRKRKIPRHPDLSVSRLYMESRSLICCFCVCLRLGRTHIVVFYAK